MILSSQNLTPRSFSDNQKRSVYLLGESLRQLSTLDGDLSLLYGDLPRDSHLEDIFYGTIAKDFGLVGIQYEVTYTDHSEWEPHSSTIRISEFDKDCVITFLHEVAHMITDLHFPVYSRQAHGAEFVSVYRYILNKYGVISLNDFDTLVAKSHKTVVGYTDFIEQIKLISNTELNDFVLNSESQFVESKYTCGADMQSIYDFDAKDWCMRIVSNTNGNLLTKWNKTAFDKTYYDLTYEDKQHVCFISPVGMFDANGIKQRNRKGNEFGVTTLEWDGARSIKEYHYFGLPSLDLHSKVDIERYEPMREKLIKRIAESGKRILITSSADEIDFWRKSLKEEI